MDKVCLDVPLPRRHRYNVPELGSIQERAVVRDVMRVEMRYRKMDWIRDKAEEQPTSFLILVLTFPRYSSRYLRR